MSSTTITIALVALALAIGAWILLRGDKAPEEDEEAVEQEQTPGLQAPARTAPPAASVPPVPANPVPAPPPAAVPAPPAVGVASIASLRPDPSGYAQHVRDRWRDLQLRFVDDPQTASAEASRLVDEALADVTASLHARRDELSRWRATSRADDTEQLRAAVYQYRDFLLRLVGP